MSAPTDGIGMAITLLHEVLAEFRTEHEDLKATLRQNEQANVDLTREVRALIQALAAPVTRKTTVDLPSGPATITTHESR